MIPKEIGRRASAIFRHQLPSNIAVRSQEDQEDYGVDFELEVTEANDQATGLLFKVQVKGTADVSINSDGGSISFSGLVLGKMRYYLTQLRLPVLFVVVDVRTEAIYWTILQGNPAIREAYVRAKAAGQESMTIRLPVGNLLCSTFDRALDDVRAAIRWLIIQGIENESSLDLIQAALRGADFDSYAAAIARHHDASRSEQIEILLRSGRRADAFEEAKKIFASESESVAMRFTAALNLMRIQPVLLRSEGNLNRDKIVSDGRLVVTSQVFKLTLRTGTDRGLRFYALFLARAARLHALVQRDFGLHLASVAQTESGDSLTRMMTDSARRPLALAVAEELKHVQRAFVRLVLREHFRFVAPAWAQMARDVVELLVRLRRDDLENSADVLSTWLDETGSVARDIARKLGNWSDVAFCALQGISLGQLGDAAAMKSRFASVKVIVSEISDQQVRDDALARLGEWEAEFGSQSLQEPSFEDASEMYAKMAAAMGVDLSDESNTIAQVVRIGIHDLNPERVLKTCRHLFVQLGSRGIPAEMLGLPTAGSKRLLCTKFGYGIEALELDAAFESMRQFHCDQCSEKQSHPDEWEWNRRWQTEQEALHGGSEF